MFENDFRQGVAAAERSKANFAAIRAVIGQLIDGVSTASQGEITASYVGDKLFFAVARRRNLGPGVKVAVIEPSEEGYPVRVTSESNRVVTCPDRATLEEALGEMLRSPATGDIVRRLVWPDEPKLEGGAGG